MEMIQLKKKKQVHGNDMVSTYFHPFSLSPPLPDHPSQIDKVKSIFHICIEKHMESGNL